MKVVLFHPCRLPPKDYGGVERVVLWLAKGLAELGHETWVAAHAGSLLPEGVRLLPVDPSRPSAADLPGYLPPGVDLVHFMAPPEAETWARLPCPGLVTVHGNGRPGEVFPPNTVFLSRDHAARHGRRRFVHNGIDPAEYVFDPASKRGRRLFLSRTGWRVKNVRGAVDLCRRAGVPLDVAGGWRPLRVHAQVALRRALGGRRGADCRWVGPVAGPRKARLLAEASALVFPILWPEPFGLVVAEALVSGTPVVASPLGSVPELLGPDVGRQPRSDAEWLQALREGFPAGTSERCRQWALDRFHYSRMARDYDGAYRELREVGSLRES